MERETHWWWDIDYRFLCNLWRGLSSTCRASEGWYNFARPFAHAWRRTPNGERCSGWCEKRPSFYETGWTFWALGWRGTIVVFFLTHDLILVQGKVLHGISTSAAPSKSSNIISSKFDCNAFPKFCQRNCPTNSQHLYRNRSDSKTS